MGSTGLILIPGIVKNAYPASAADWTQLENLFLHPPDSARPWVFWMWMNGNITKEGITLDLEAMKRMGIGGAICFNSAVGIPRGPVDYAGEAWMDATEFAIKEADRLGLQVSIHNSPGYSGSGGPWVTPEMSMQQLVWTETQIKNQHSVEIHLPQPFARMGYYRDAFVLAYPSLEAENGLMRERLIRFIADGKEVEKDILCDGNSGTKIRLAPSDGQSSFLLMEFGEPFEARSITITRKAEIPRDLFDGPRDHPPHFDLEKSDNGREFIKIAAFNCPELRAMDTPAMQNFKATKAKYYRLVTSDPTWVSGVELHSAPRLAGWPGKTSCTHGNFIGNEADVSDQLLIDPKSVIDLTSLMDQNGFLKWDTGSRGNWTIVRIGHTTTGEEPAAHPDAGKGLEIDKFRKEALDFHFEKFSMPLVNRLLKYKGKSFVGFTIDSWEAGKQNWTVGFPREFEKLRKYKLAPWLLAMTGRIIGNVDQTERFLWDARKTQAELLSANYYGHWQDWSHKNGLQFYAEPYGDGNLDSLEIGRYLDIPMAEFWSRYFYGSDATSKQAVSLAHVYGKPLAAAEAFTGMPATSKWTDYPFSLKAEGDWFFSLGINRLVFHTFVHQPYTTGFPGMMMGPFGTHFDRNNSWTEQAQGWTGHIRRAQYLLQQGLTVADVCYFKGDEPQTGVPDIYPMMPEGIVGDVVGRDALFSQFSIQDGRIVLPDRMSYRICIMANIQAILPDTLRRLKELVSQGMVLVVNSKPNMSLGLTGGDEEVKNLTDLVYGKLDGIITKQVQSGKGKLFWGISIREVLEQLSVPPDFLYSAENQDAIIHYTHKTIDNTEFYFVANHRRRKENIVCSIRAGHMQPEIWNSETGEIFNVAGFKTVNGRLQMPMELSPAGSAFIILRKKAATGILNHISKDGVVLYDNRSYAKPDAARFENVRNSFTISLWIKPDTFAHGGRSMLFHPSEGELVYGPGHAVCGLGAGQNGVFVYEKSRGNARNVLIYNGQITGWTHLALSWQQGVPALFLNGKKVIQGVNSGMIVHPGLESIVSDDQFTTQFEGNFTKPELHRTTLTAKEVDILYQKGLPDPNLLTPATFKISKAGKLVASFLQNGTYEMVKSSGIKEKISVISCEEKILVGSWKVGFPKGSGAPGQIELTSLVSLIKYDDFNVRHFSGTCTYAHQINLASTDFTTGRKFLLDLGRVEVIARVFINGKEAGLYWKEPFVADITGLVKPGENDLKVEVTNLWPNRLIGDEHLPVENEYTKDHFITKLPEWYIKNLSKPGKRFSFAVWHNFEKTDPLLESGLLGPVKLILGEERILNGWET